MFIVEISPCSRVVTKHDASDNRKSCELADEVRRGNDARAKLIFLEKYDVFILNPLYGAGLSYQAQDTVRRQILFTVAHEVYNLCFRRRPTSPRVDRRWLTRAGFCRCKCRRVREERATRNSGAPNRRRAGRRSSRCIDTPTWVKATPSNSYSRKDTIRTKPTPIRGRLCTMRRGTASWKLCRCY